MFILFKPETLFLGKIGPINQNCQFKLEFGNYTNSNIQNSMVMFTFSALYRKHPFWETKVNEARLLSLRPDGSRDLEMSSTRLFYFVTMSASVD